MRDVTLNEIKEFAIENMDLPESEQVSVDDPKGEFTVTNPWIDRSARFTLTDEQAEAEWGRAAVDEFCRKAKAVLEMREHR